MTRKVKYDRAAQLAILKEYEEAEHGTRKDLALRLGIAQATLAVLVCRWRKRIREEAEELQGRTETRLQPGAAPAPWEG